MPKLIVTETGQTGEKVVNLGGEALIGRVPEADLQLSGDGISREHAKIILEENHYYILDLGSGNGTLLNGMQIKPQEKNLLRNNDRIVIENYHLRFWRTDEFFDASLKDEEEVTDADILEIKLLKKVLDAVDQETVPSFEVLNGSSEGKRVFLTDDTPELIIGRDPSCDFPINEYVISRNHAKITKKWGGIALVDCDSKNGCFVNNKRIKEEFLHDGDRIALGTIVLLFRNPQEINLKEIGEELAKKRTTDQGLRTRDLGAGRGDQGPRTMDLPAGRQGKGLGDRGEQQEETEGKSTEEILKDIPSFKSSPANVYPVPTLHTKQMTPFEIGMIGLGIAVLCFALITLVNLLLQ